MFDSFFLSSYDTKSVLYKRKIENYVPLDILFGNITSINEQQESDLSNKSNDELDFIEYGNGKDQFKIGIPEDKIKEQFPGIFLSPFSYRDLEERCKHHKVYLPEANEEVSEIEIILLKIAKII
jgi:protein-tyrosine phosphatase